MVVAWVSVRGGARACVQTLNSDIFAQLRTTSIILGVYHTSTLLTGVQWRTGLGGLLQKITAILPLRCTQRQGAVSHSKSCVHEP